MSCFCTFFNDLIDAILLKIERKKILAMIDKGQFVDSSSKLQNVKTKY